MKIIRSLAFPTLALSCLVAPALADDQCKPLRLIESIDMTPVAGGARMTVPVTVNGKTQNFLVATGAGATSLTAAAGAALGLHVWYNDFEVLTGGVLLDFNGYASHHFFHLDNFQIGNLQRDFFYTLMTPDPNLGVSPPFDGLLAGDLIYHYDVELDFAAHKFNVFWQDHCPGQGVHWPAASIGVAEATWRYRQDDVKRRNSAGSSGIVVEGVDIRTTVLLDGKPFTANIDTGEEVSTLNTTSARVAYEVMADSPGSKPSGGVIAAAPADGKGAPAAETVLVNGQKDVFLPHVSHFVVRRRDSHQPALPGAAGSDRRQRSGKYYCDRYPYRAGR